MLVAGQFVALLFLLHTALPSSIASYVVGVLSSVLNVIYFVSVGYLIHWSVSVTRYYEVLVSSLQSQQPSYSDYSYSDYSYSDYSYSDYSYSNSSGSRTDLLRTISHLLAVRCILAGTILMTISWGVIQLLFFYKAQTDSQNQRSLWRVVREFVTDLPTSTLQLKAKLAIGKLI